MDDKELTFDRGSVTGRGQLPDPAPDGRQGHQHLQQSRPVRFAPCAAFRGRYDDGLPEGGPPSVEELAAKYAGTFHKYGPPVVCLDRPEWGEMTPTRAAERVGCHPKQIHGGLANGYRVRGLRFVRIGESWAPKKTPGRRTTAVVCVETGERYSSVKVTAERLGIHRSRIFNSMVYGTAASGLHFRRAADDDYCPVPARTRSATKFAFDNGSGVGCKRGRGTKKKGAAA